MAANNTNQRNITDYFNTISNSKQRKNGKSIIINNDCMVNKSICTNENIEEIISKKPTPKRRRAITNVTKSAPASKKSKTTTISKKTSTIRTETKMVRRGRCPIDFGPADVIRKLDFDDCIDSSSHSDQNNNNDSSSNSFSDFLKSKATEKNSESVTMKSSSAMAQTPLMKADDIKERLRSCKNLSKLKEELVNINNCGEKIRQFKEMKIKYQQNINSPIKSSPIKSSPRKTTTIFGSPMKAVAISSSPSSINKFNSVSSPIKPRNLLGSLLKTPSKKNSDDQNELDLPLPKSFKRLVDLFKIIDYNSWRMYKRQEVCTFDKMKQVVEDSTHRTFTLDAMLKILTIMKQNPRFRLAWELYAGHCKLVLTPIYAQNNMKCLNSVGTLLNREKEFHRYLLELTRVEHLKFLSQMKLNLNDDDQIYRWHPMFRLDSIPDIKPDYTLLPSKPIGSSSNKTVKKSTILDYFGPKQTTIESAKSKSECSINDKNKSNENDGVDDKNKIKSGLLKGISSDLLNKVRAKEAAKLARLMRRPPEKDREIRMLSKLVDISRIIYDCFLGSSIRSIEKEDLIQRISNSMPMSIGESRSHLDYLCKFELDVIGTKWIKVIQLQNAEYIQIDTTYPLANLCQAFRKHMQKLQSN
ncbi:replication licensing factor Cdt1 [Dermatophagoides farinae]|uniref:Replication licensing factor Cdt1 n=1 Tax=Dermatophagoides farinae TaxID=6954 RepID=A0A922HWH0_DERFA|nr:replication licensing factor Cdt1 [Dermatophagoides farinae]